MSKNNNQEASERNEVLSIAERVQFITAHLGSVSAESQLISEYTDQYVVLRATRQSATVHLNATDLPEWDRLVLNVAVWKTDHRYRQGRWCQYIDDLYDRAKAKALQNSKLTKLMQDTQTAPVNDSAHFANYPQMPVELDKPVVFKQAETRLLPELMPESKGGLYTYNGSLYLLLSNEWGFYVSEVLAHRQVTDYQPSKIRALIQKSIEEKESE